LLNKLAIPAILTITVILFIAASENLQDAEALKGKGVGTAQYGSQTDVCGLQLCSEIPGGKAAWMEQQKISTPVAPVTEEKTIELEEEITMDETMMEEPMMEETMMEKVTEADLGSVLRLSRANVPAVIPLHQGYYDGGDVYFIITDSSDPKHAEIITENQGWQVELAPLLANAPDDALSKTFLKFSKLSK